MIKGDKTHGSSDARTKGYRLALSHAGIAIDEELIEQGKFNFESGLQAARVLLALDKPPTAIFAQNDDMAAGVIAAAHDQGIVIPDELSVVGYDDSAIAKIVYPRLTTIHQPVREMAHAAADMLVAMVENQPFSELVEHPYALVVRDSAGSAPE